MTENIKQKLKSKDYEFLRDNENLGNNILLLGLSGSYAYGTNIDASDIDIRGVATNSNDNILTYKDFNCFVSTNTDTTIFSLEKFLKLLISCNPTCIELLGLRKEDYLFVSSYGELILKNKGIFLSQNVCKSFGGYITSIKKKLENIENISAEKINKNMMHLVRLYYMAFDILEKGKIITYRSKENELLINIRNSVFLDVNNKPNSDYLDLLSKLEKRFVYDKRNTNLPPEADIKNIRKLHEYINREAVFQTLPY